ncbi:Laminin Subunit Alpha-2 [Manis pentadactyla]|nr:Laminin Subunit Alpha-2 [Manis pentadactyla]
MEKSRLRCILLSSLKIKSQPSRNEQCDKYHACRSLCDQSSFHRNQKEPDSKFLSIVTISITFRGICIYNTYVLLSLMISIYIPNIMHIITGFAALD